MRNAAQEYKHLRALNSNIRLTKQRLINGIMKIVTPFMWETGYVTSIDDKKSLFDGNNSRSLLAYFFKRKEGYKPKLKNVFSMANEYTGIYGFTENDAVITDAYGGGLVCNSLHDFTIEDIITLWAWVERNQDKFKK